jgi:hypothetical protein
MGRRRSSLTPILAFEQLERVGLSIVVESALFAGRRAGRPVGPTLERRWWEVAGWLRCVHRSRHIRLTRLVGTVGLVKIRRFGDEHRV